jgi:glutathione S-transferase
MDRLTLYTNPRSRGRIAHWMLEETGQPYDTVALGFGLPMRTPDFLALNPMGKIPVVTYGPHVVTECAAICTWLAETFPEAGLMPDDRARFYRWMFWAAGPLETAITNTALGLIPPADRRGMVGYGNFDLVIDTLEALVGGPDYICGPRFSAADVYIGSQIGWGLMFKTLPDRPAFQAYWARIKDRPAHLRAETLADAAQPEAV